MHIPYKTRILGSAAYSMCSLARGSALIAFEAAAKIWDIAGAWLLIPEAGGVIETLNVNLPFPLIPGKDYSIQNYPALATTTPELLVKSREQLVIKL